jgi:diguanylate cyclase
MAADPLIEALPDLLLLVRRDGTVLDHGGGHGLAGLKPAEHSAGKRLAEIWPGPVAELIRRLTRRSIAERSSSEARFQQAGRDYEVRASAQGPDRALCVIRPMTAAAPDEALDATGELPRPQLDRRGFLRRFREAMSMAALCEKPIAVAVIHIDGMIDVAQIIDSKIAERLMSSALLRLSGQGAATAAEKATWFLGQLSDNLLALVLETSDRETIDGQLRQVCASLREPIGLGDAEFHLTPYAGVAILGRDATSPKMLLDHARAAASQARSSGANKVCFFTDTLRLRSLARLDIARELQEAIANGDVCLRYVGRHDLATGRLITWVGYLRWIHPIRGEIRPADFLRIAESTGLATALSRTVLSCLQRDYAVLAPHWDADVRISFGALRHHILHDEFAADICQFLQAGAVPAERLELRIAEKTFIAREGASLKQLRQLGVQLVVDEVGRGLGSLDGLARAPIWGLQLDRACVAASRRDEVALRICRAAVGLANALGLTAIATGVDDHVQRLALLGLGCRYGSGQLYQNLVPEMMQPYRAAVSD